MKKITSNDGNSEVFFKNVDKNLNNIYSEKHNSSKAKQSDL